MITRDIFTYFSSWRTHKKKEMKKNDFFEPPAKQKNHLFRLQKKLFYLKPLQSVSSSSPSSSSHVTHPEVAFFRQHVQPSPSH